MEQNDNDDDDKTHSVWQPIRRIENEMLWLYVYNVDDWCLFFFLSTLRRSFCCVFFFWLNFFFVHFNRNNKAFSIVWCSLFYFLCSTTIYTQTICTKSFWRSYSVFCFFLFQIYNCAFLCVDFHNISMSLTVLTLSCHHF